MMRFGWCLWTAGGVGEPGDLSFGVAKHMLFGNQGPHAWLGNP